MFWGWWSQQDRSLWYYNVVSAQFRIEYQVEIHENFNPIDPVLGQT